MPKNRTARLPTNPTRKNIKIDKNHIFKSYVHRVGERHSRRSVCRGKTPHAAMRMARNVLKKKDSSPYAWGGFILMGD